MELPSARELELEVLLRERESQLAELKDEVLSLRRHLSRDPGPSKTEPVTLPPAVMSILLPHIDAANKDAATSVSATVAGGLNQRMRQLQQENDELYNVLKASETGKLKDEVRSLRRAVAKLEGALKESHQVISSLSEELEKTHEALRNSSRHKDSTQAYSRPYSKSPHTSYRSELPPSNSSNTAKPTPTGPRAHKRLRLSEPHSPPPQRTVAPLPAKPQAQNHAHSPHAPHHPPIGPMRDQGRQSGSVTSESTRIHRTTSSNAPSSNHNQKMEVDGVESSRATSPVTIRERERDRARERDKNNRERERRDRESRDVNPSSTTTVPSKPPAGNPTARRNGNFSNASGRGSGGGGGRKVTNSSNSHASDNRTLQERMGL